MNCKIWEGREIIFYFLRLLNMKITKVRLKMAVGRDNRPAGIEYIAFTGYSDSYKECWSLSDPKWFWGYYTLIEEYTL